MARIVLCCSYVIGVSSHGQQEDEDESYCPSLKPSVCNSIYLKIGACKTNPLLLLVRPNVDHSLFSQSVNFVMPDPTVNIKIAA